jgi:hypothetical protein
MGWSKAAHAVETGYPFCSNDIRLPTHKLPVLGKLAAPKSLIKSILPIERDLYFEPQTLGKLEGMHKHFRGER